jgi:hypothetical protein
VNGAHAFHSSNGNANGNGNGNNNGNWNYARHVNAGWYPHGRYPYLVNTYYGYGYGGFPWYGYNPWWNYYPWLDADWSAQILGPSADDDMNEPGYGNSISLTTGQPMQQDGYAQDDQGAEYADESDAAITGVQATTAGTSGLTIVFKNGQMPEHASNYIVSSSAVTVSDGERIQTIPWSALDLEAMARDNPGVTLPSGP